MAMAMASHVVFDTSIRPPTDVQQTIDRRTYNNEQRLMGNDDDGDNHFENKIAKIRLCLSLWLWLLPVMDVHNIPQKTISFEGFLLAFYRVAFV